MDDLELRGILGSISVRKLDDKIREGLEKLVKQLLAVNDEFQEDLLKIKIDENLTAKGKKAKVQEIGDAILELLEPYQDVYKEHIEQTEKALFSDPNDGEKSIAEQLINQFRNMEIRQHFKVAEMDELQMEALIDKPGFVEAVVTSPMPLLPKDRLQALVRKKAEKDRPEIAQRLGQYDFSAATVKGLISKIESDIRASGWKNPEDLLNPTPEPFVDEIAKLAAS